MGRAEILAFELKVQGSKGKCIHLYSTDSALKKRKSNRHIYTESIYVCMRVYVYICVYIYIYTHT